MQTATLPISALQHWLFCPRQCCLIHVERLWEENLYTAEGRLLHEKADSPGTSRRDSIHTLRALPLASKRLGLSGVADVVELNEGIPFPVEYKRGRPKAHRADEVQLCAQAMCLEEMFEVSVEQGALFYGKTRRRKAVAFDAELRHLTEQVASEATAAIDAGDVPSPVYEKRRCNACSLAGICRPRQLANPPVIAKWLLRQVNATGENDA